MGHSSPNGTNILASSEHTIRFVTVPCLYGVLAIILIELLNLPLKLVLVI